MAGQTIDIVNEPSIKKVKAYLLNLQENICHGLEQEETKASFATDQWQHAGGGGGISRVMTSGETFEQAGVNFSHVQGDKLPASATALRPELEGRRFQAVGVSLVIHPLNPYVPTSHANVRFFYCRTRKRSRNMVVWWRIRPDPILSIRRGCSSLAPNCLKCL